MNRPTFDEIFAQLATSIARRSTCRRLQVGAVITSLDHRRVYAVGYNGNASGLPNDCDRHGDDAVGNCGCIHAELNALINCDSPRQLPKIVYCTHLPCVMCAKAIINLGGVMSVRYISDYRKRDALDLFAAAGIDAYMLQQ